jgi:hypothetical protein
MAIPVGPIFTGDTAQVAHDRADEWLRLYRSGVSRANYRIITYASPGIGGHAARIETNERAKIA